jgi:U3 small nucleolar RNA-associated protein 3
MGRPRKTSTQFSEKGNRSKQATDPTLFDSNRNGNDDEDEIDTFYKERDDNLRTALSKTTKKKSSINKKSVSWALDDDDDQNGRDEVLAFDDDDSMASDDNEYQQIAGDEEEEEIDEDLGGSWGSSRKAFYNEDANADDEDAKLEEQEAVQIQKKYYDMLEKTDFGLDLFQQKPPTSSNNRNLDEQSLRRHIILPDNLLELSSNDRLQLIRDQSPELEPLCHEFKNIFDDLKIYLLPLIQLVIDTSSIEEFQSYSGWQFVLSILELYLTYCSYLSLYLMMKSKDLNLSKHPVLNDIEQYRKLCQLVNDDFQFMKNDLLKLCEVLQERKTQINQKQKDVLVKPHLIMNKKILLSTKTTNGTNDKPSLRERMMKRREQQVKDAIQDPSQEDQPQKRRITYEIEKNKGLTAKRKKEYRNPRVRNRNKYARALIKRTSHVPTARTEEERYGGEPTGIRAGIKRGIKLKS